MGAHGINFQNTNLSLTLWSIWGGSIDFSPKQFWYLFEKKIQLGRLQKNHIFTLPQGSTLLSYYYIQHNAILYKTNIPNTDCIFVTIAVILQREISPILLVVIGENYNIENL